MILFVGGSRHGTEYVRTVTVDKPDPAPPSFVDVQTAERYALAPVSMTMLSPVTNQPVAILENTVYLVEGLTDPQQVAMGLTDSVTRWWFQTHGTRKDLAPVLAQQNGHPQRTWYTAVCHDCDPAPMPFADPGARAKWMQAHIEATGHQVTWSDDPAVPTPKENGE